jgi:hypothetical protein
MEWALKNTNELQYLLRLAYLAKKISNPTEYNLALTEAARILPYYEQNKTSQEYVAQLNNLIPLVGKFVSFVESLGGAEAIKNAAEEYIKSLKPTPPDIFSEILQGAVVDFLTIDQHRPLGFEMEFDEDFEEYEQGEFPEEMDIDSTELISNAPIAGLSDVPHIFDELAVLSNKLDALPTRNELKAQIEELQSPDVALDELRKKLDKNISHLLDLGERLNKLIPQLQSQQNSTLATIQPLLTSIQKMNQERASEVDSLTNNLQELQQLKRDQTKFVEHNKEYITNAEKLKTMFSNWSKTLTDFQTSAIEDTAAYRKLISDTKNSLDQDLVNFSVIRNEAIAVVEQSIDSKITVTLETINEKLEDLVSTIKLERPRKRPKVPFAEEDSEMQS